MMGKAALGEGALRGWERLWALAYDWCSARVDARGAAEHRRALCEAAEGLVLEIGAGTGLNFVHYGAARHVAAIEPGAEMRRRARPRASEAPVPVSLAAADAQQLPFAAASFDTVVVGLALCTIPDPALALAEIRRVLRRGGTLRFYEHVRARDPKLARRQDRLARLWRLVGRGCHPNRETVGAIAACGFSVAEVEEFDLEPAPAIVRPHVLGVAHRD